MSCCPLFHCCGYKVLIEQALHSRRHFLWGQGTLLCRQLQINSLRKWSAMLSQDETAMVKLHYEKLNQFKATEFNEIIKRAKRSISYEHKKSLVTRFIFLSYSNLYCNGFMVKTDTLWFSTCFLYLSFLINENGCLRQMIWWTAWNRKKISKINRLAQVTAWLFRGDTKKWPIQINNIHIIQESNVDTYRHWYFSDYTKEKLSKELHLF